MTMKVTATIVLIYAILLLVGGWMGHVKAASMASLISGLIFGTLMLLCAWGIAAGKKFAQFATLILIFILDGFFTYRFAKTLAFFPAGMMSLLSLAVLIVVALKIRKTQKIR